MKGFWNSVNQIKKGVEHDGWSKRTEEELRDASKHLFYEIQMLLGTAKKLSILRGCQDEVLKNAVLEAFLIHARNLIDFLYTKPVQDDVAIEDFLEKAGKGEGIPAQSSFLCHQTKRINKKLAHLTYFRVLDEDVWDYLRITEEIRGPLNVFLAQVPRELLDSSWNGISSFEDC